jgi:2-polyprenyl-3-methyl-5-hydroxy-6-metoxy-1,4-benzoquinol methylase
MDDPNLAAGSLRDALAGIARTNGWGTTRRYIWRALCGAARRHQLDSLRILDVACGAGDLAVWLAQRARQRGLHWLVEGCDKSLVAVKFAAARATDAGLHSLRFFSHDACDPLPSSTYDVVLSTLFLHHLAEDQATEFLGNVAAAAEHAVLIDDLRRSAFGYALARLGSTVLTRSPVVRIDAPLSVQSAFSESEALSLFTRVGMHGATLRRHWPERYLIAWEKS